MLITVTDMIKRNVKYVILITVTDIVNMYNNINIFTLISHDFLQVACLVLILLTYQQLDKCFFWKMK
jgi:hypothetical protein